jgi:hypothetical protein
MEWAGPKKPGPFGFTVLRWYQTGDKVGLTTLTT